MPRARARPLFELGDQWIAKDPGSPFLHRFWTEPGTGRTRRASLGTTDLQEAKLKLADIVLKVSLKSATTPLSIVLEHYFCDHADGLPSGKIARGHGRKLLAFFGTTCRVDSLTEAKQKSFVRECLDHGFKVTYAARIMVTLSAALAHSNIRVPEVIYTESAMIKRWKLRPALPVKAYIPTDEECARLMQSEMPQMLRRWFIIQALTGGRPQTAIDLAPSQFDQEAGVVDLNPLDRAQNKKFRAKVRAPRSLRLMLRVWQRRGLGPFGERYCGYTTLEGVKTALQRLAAATGIPVSTYSVRQKVTTVLRRAGVPEDQVAMVLGHRRTNLRTTAGYGEWDPSYQREAAQALEAWFWKIRHLAKKIKANSRDTPEALPGPIRRRAKPL